MDPLRLPLYPTLEPRPKVTPLFEDKKPEENKPTNPLASLESALNAILPTSEDETNIIRTRRILSKTAESLSDEQIECMVTEFQFLINSWLDEFERDTFSGKTLKEVLQEG